MGTAKFSGDSKRDAVAQITERGHAAAAGSRRLGAGQHSIYTWRKKFSQPSSGDDKDAGIKGLRDELVRVTEEGDILKKAAAYFAKDAKRDARSLPRIAR